MKHDYEETRTVYDKSKPFDPKTMPIADYWKGRTCKVCGASGGSEVGYIIEGKDYPYGLASGGSNEECSG